ncbi:hypothetical protein LPJ61_001516 [Coemansia biformis]|uniref:Uncharacterized protein n=1 Tax=Coemansia biformis TaxID=1286918 RepID=A0A9W8D0J3_9FUNG|nr:hypothetical protein LPJ61_001516 [Coemansia biformis]
MSDVYAMLETMDREGLSGPPPMDGSLRLDAQVMDKYADDSEDPRWNALFVQYFIESEEAGHDDMLFFVRHADDTGGESTAVEAGGRARGGGGGDERDPVFVLRKQSPPSALPPMSELVMWKETFLLNLIVQMPCKLTVAVCRRKVKQGAQRSGMSVVRKHVSKRVYALPSRSRMDRPRDTASPPECSWPHIYYVIDDYEEMFEDMFIKKGEYLCVELSARIPAPNMPDDALATPPSGPLSGSSEKPVSLVSQDGSTGVFNSVRSRLTSAAASAGSCKIVLFQGAASFGALVDNYVHRLSSKNMLHRLRKPTYTPEFIMMRGPGGKGHAQVAITGRSVTDEADLASRNVSLAPSPVLQPHPSAPSIPAMPAAAMAAAAAANAAVSSGTGANGPWPKLPAIASPHLQPISVVNSTPASPSLSAWLKRISLPSIAENLSQATGPPPPPKSLQASMTFVSIPWNSIIEDLLNFKRQLD